MTFIKTSTVCVGITHRAISMNRRFRRDMPVGALSTLTWRSEVCMVDVRRHSTEMPDVVCWLPDLVSWCAHALDGCCATANTVVQTFAASCSLSRIGTSDKAVIYVPSGLLRLTLFESRGASPLEKGFGEWRNRETHQSQRCDTPEAGRKVDTDQRAQTLLLLRLTFDF